MNNPNWSLCIRGFVLLRSLTLYPARPPVTIISSHNWSGFGSAGPLVYSVTQSQNQPLLWWTQMHFNGHVVYVDCSLILFIRDNSNGRVRLVGWLVGSTRVTTLCMYVCTCNTVYTIICFPPQHATTESGKLRSTTLLRMQL